MIHSPAFRHERKKNRTVFANGFLSKRNGNIFSLTRHTSACREIFSEPCRIKLNLNNTFPIDLVWCQINQINIITIKIRFDLTSNRKYLGHFPWFYLSVKINQPWGEMKSLLNIQIWTMLHSSCRHNPYKEACIYVYIYTVHI